MKKAVFMLLAFAGLCGMQAQTKGNIEFGLGAGANFSSLYAPNTYNTTDTNFAFNAGGSAEYYFSDRWGIKVKVTYDRKGWDNDFITDIQGNDYSTNVNLDYLTVPVMANWHFGAKRNWYLNFGVYTGFLMSAKETRFDTDIKDEFETTDIGLVAGIGVKIPVSEFVKIFIEFEQQGGGFNKLFKDTNNFEGRFANSRNALNVGINFML